MAVLTHDQLFLKIDAYIRTNNNKEIDAVKLNSLLKDMYDSLATTPTDVKTYTFNNVSTVTIVHGLNRKPLFQVLNAAGEPITATTSVTDNTINITFSKPLSGFCNYV